VVSARSALRTHLTATVTGSGETYDVYFNPTGESGPSLVGGTGQQLSVNLYYTNNQPGQHVDNLSVAVASSNPGEKTTLAAPTSITWNGFTASWGNQQSTGAVYVNVSGVPPYTIQGAFLSNQAYNYWSCGSLQSSGQPLTLVSQNGTNATLSFSPDTNEAGDTLTLRLDFGSYGQQATQFLGGYSDPGLAEKISSSTYTEPAGASGAQIQADANQYGTLYLSAGSTYYMNQQLILNKPVTIESAPGPKATLIFTQPQPQPQPPSDAVNIWPDAVEIKASNVTLENFIIQFSGPFLWTTTGGSSTGVINTYVNTSDITISGMIIQGPTQSLFDQATDPTDSSVPQNQIFEDQFTNTTLDSQWTPLGGTWKEGGGTLSQTSNSTSPGVRKVIVNSSTPFPGAEEIEANVNLDSISVDGRAGVSLDNNSSGSGYNLVFHLNGSTLSVQLLNDGVDWSQPITEDVNNNDGAWQEFKWYTFELVVVPQGNGVDALFGKVWLTTQTQPTQWTITEIQGSGQSRSPGVPALEGGSSGNNGGGAMADFQPVNGPNWDHGTYGNIVWAVTPSLFSAVDSEGHQHWHEQAGHLPDGRNRAVLHDDHRRGDSVNQYH
jgi:hypothetical protein